MFAQSISGRSRGTLDAISMIGVAFLPLA